MKLYIPINYLNNLVIAHEKESERLKNCGCVKDNQLSKVLAARTQLKEAIKILKENET